MPVHSRTVVVLPAYNAAATLEDTFNDLPMEFVDEVILVDDASSDNTVELARSLGITVVAHRENVGYGGNQKTCYAKALELDADFVVLSPVQKTASHPDMPAMGWEVFSSMIEDIPVPVYALGGVSGDDLETAWSHGAQGVAAISAFWG